MQTWGCFSDCDLASLLAGFFRTIVPDAISKYVTTNFADQSIVEISRKRGGYEVELSNGTELKLTEDAKPFTEKRGGQRGQAPRNRRQ